MNIPIRELKDELRNHIDECKTTMSYDNLIISKSVFGLFSKLINKFERTKSYQTGLFIKSMDDWIDRENSENKPLDNKLSFETVKRGDIYMVDWNLGYSPELSYEHPCVVVEILDGFIFVLPVSSQPQYIKLAYHPVFNTEGNKNYRIVDKEDGFSKQCVIHLNQGKCISTTRILYKIGTLSFNLDGKSELYTEIREYLLTSYFSDEYNRLVEENSEYKRKNEYLSAQRKSNQSRADKYRNENKILKQKLDELQCIVDKKDNQ